MLNLLTILILSYLVGSIPTSILVSKKVKGIDIRNHGSGNAGGTNVMRVLGWKYGVLVILLDALKGAVAVLVVAKLFYGNFPFPNQTPFDDLTLVQILAGISAVLGHIWTIFAGFKGGKGIATALGFMLTVATIDMLLAMAVFVLVVSISRYISLGSILAAISVPVIMFIRSDLFGATITGYGTILPFAIVLAVLVIYTHRANVQRLLNGNENRVSFQKKK